VKSRVLVVTVAALLALSLSVHVQPAGPVASGLTEKDREPVPAERVVSRPVGGELTTPPNNKAEGLIAAQVALRCGDCLLHEARRHSGETCRALLELAAGQYTACLTHETAQPGATFFADARHNLEQTRRILGHPSQPDRALARTPAVLAHELLPLPQVTPRQPTAQTTAQTERASRAAPLPPVASALMVGPDGVIYQKIAVSH
jgi:hypothetical protein